MKDAHAEREEMTHRMGEKMMKYRILPAARFPERAAYKALVAPLQRGETIEIPVASKAEAYKKRAVLVSSLKRWLPTTHYVLHSSVSDTHVYLKARKPQ
jgi:hypothetical protein